MATRRRDVRKARQAKAVAQNDVPPKAVRVVNPKDGVRHVPTPKKNVKATQE